MNNSALWIVLHRMRTPLMVLIITYSVAIIGLLFIDGLDNHGNIYHMSIFDAFYVVTYTATTIGFGELPYEFTYAQRIWMSMTMYATVLGWFYSIGSLVALLQDKLLLAQIAEAKFRKQVNNINQHFLLILGYNYTTSEIIKKANAEGIRTIVIEKDINKINELLLENFTPTVPCLMADVYDPLALEKAGIHSKYCKAIVSLFSNDSLNLRIAITAKLLNPSVRLAVKSTTKAHDEDLKDLNVEIVENPFEIIAEQIEMAICNPYMLVLQRWFYGIGDLDTKVITLPKGKYIVCGFGRMGKVLNQVLSKNGIDTVFIEPNKKELRGISAELREKIIVGSADEKDSLKEAGIKDAQVIIASSDDDTMNLSMLASARKLNPDILTIARENDMADMSIFNNAKIDLVFIPARVLINKTTNALIAPYSNKFLTYMIQKSDPIYTKQLVDRMFNKLGANPITFGITLNVEKAFAVHQYLSQKDEHIPLDIFSRSREDRTKKNKIIPLILIRKSGNILLPSWDIRLQLNDKILFAADDYDTMSDVKWICENKYEFYYIYKGRERNMFKELFNRSK